MEWKQARNILIFSWLYQSKYWYLCLSKQGGETLSQEYFIIGLLNSPLVAHIDCSAPGGKQDETLT